MDDPRIDPPEPIETVELDEDLAPVRCPGCGESVCFGDVAWSRNKCIWCEED
jgi:hypothetical protein